MIEKSNEAMASCAITTTVSHDTISRKALRHISSGQPESLVADFICDLVVD